MIEFGADFPKEPEEITVDWLHRVFEIAGQNENSIDTIEVVPTTPGFGAICDYARVNVTYKTKTAEAPDGLFAKFSANRPGSVVSATREVNFYRDLATRIDASIPRCFGCAASDDHCFLLFEYEEGQNGDSLSGCPVELAESIVRELAKLHACWWDHPYLNELKWLSPPTGKSEFLLSICDAWIPFRSQFGESLSDRTAKLIEPVLEDVPAFFRSLLLPPRTLTHGDVQLDNMMFGPDGSLKVILDWGNVRHHSGAADIAWFLSHSFPVETRRRIGDRLIATYFEALSEFDAVSVTLDDIYRNIKLRFISDFLILIGASQRANYASQRGASLLTAFVERAVAILEDYEITDAFGDI